VNFYTGEIPGGSRGVVSEAETGRERESERKREHNGPS